MEYFLVLAKSISGNQDSSSLLPMICIHRKLDYIQVINALFYLKTRKFYLKTLEYQSTFSDACIRIYLYLLKSLTSLYSFLYIPFCIFHSSYAILHMLFFICYSLYAILYMLLQVHTNIKFYNYVHIIFRYEYSNIFKSNGS